METKMQFYSQLAEESLKRLTTSSENWTSYLTTASRIYKYPFEEQLMIYAQRPDAIACASIDIWNTPMNRYVRRGSKGIGLIDDTSGRPRLKYVFDYADTEDGRHNPQRLSLWELKQENIAIVRKTLAKSYGDIEGSLTDMLFNIAYKLAKEYYNDNAHDIQYSIKGSFLEEYEEIKTTVRFVEALTNSTAYSLMERCGLDTSDDLTFGDKAFDCIYDFNTPDTINALGTAVSTISGQVLREIGAIIKNYERQIASERSTDYGELNVHQERGLLSSQPEVTGTAGQIIREIRTNAPELPQGTPQDILQFNASEGGTVSAPVRDRPDSRQTAGAVDGRTGSDKPTSGQSSESDGMGSMYEQPESTGRGIYTGRTDLQLENQVQGAADKTAPFFVAEKIQLDYELETPPLTTAGLSNTENGSQLGVNYQAGQIYVPISDILDKSGISTEIVDAMLRDGGNKKNSVLRITAHYMKGKNPLENKEFLKQEYNVGGKGFIIDNKKFSMWHDEIGIAFAVGSSARHAIRKVNLSWTQVESRIRELLYTGCYLPQNELDMVTSFEHKELAEKLWYLHQDSAESFFMDEAVFKNGFPSSTAYIANMLSQPVELESIIDGLKAFCSAYEENRSLLRIHSLNPHELLQRLLDLQMMPVTFTASKIPSVSCEPFVNEDDIETFLSQGSGVVGSKFRIYSYFLHEHTHIEKMNFLKDEYGMGGSFIHGADNSHEQHDAKGIILSRMNNSEHETKVFVPWNRAARLIDELINSGSYMNRAEIEHIPFYEKDILARNIVNFYDNLPLDMLRPFSTGMGFGQEKKIYAVMEMLDDSVKIETLLESMRPIWKVTPPEDRYYGIRQKAYTDLTAYFDGTYTLFPQLSAVEMPEDSITVRTPAMPIVIPSPEFEQISLFSLPTVEEQKTAISQAEKIWNTVQAASTLSIPVIEQSDIDEAIRNWNGNPDSKILIYTYMSDNTHARAHGTSDFLKKEYSRYGQGDGNLSGFPVTKDGAESVILSWAKVQHRIIHLLETDQFLTSGEQDIYRNLMDNAEIPQKIIADNETQELNESVELENIGFLLSESAVINLESRENLSSGSNTQVRHGSDTDNPKTAYAVDDTVYLENDRRFIIEHIGKHDIRLYDPNLIIPISRAISVLDFEALLRENPRNSHYFSDPLIPAASASGHQIKPHQQNRINFQITDEHLGEGSAKIKFNYNAEAIRTLKLIESENRLATPAEQVILSRYVGWGGLPQVFDSENENWTKQCTELQTLLTYEEYDMARASTLNAHYTSPTVIKAIYDTVGRMGFKTGNILEPACGVGNFFGLLPESMKNSKLHGVELDAITGRIAKQLYQKASIKVAGYEKTDTSDSFFDLAIGNVPFGSYKVIDKRYDKHNFYIHDYFLAKTLDQVRPGGIIAFITSKGTMDKQNPDVRKYIAQRAELLGAVRLPNNAFLRNAGTSVTSDILFFQKRESIIDIQPDWINIVKTSDGIPLNSYFAEHPEMILGTMANNNMMYGNENETTCIPIPGAELAGQLKSALANINGTIAEPELDDISEMAAGASVSADSQVKNFSYALATPIAADGDIYAGKIGEATADSRVYYRENSRMYPVNQPKTTLERIKGMIALRDCTQDLIEYQLQEYSDAEIATKQADLNRLYDDFTGKFGLINSRSNSLAFADDSSYYLLCSLEILDENGGLAQKADMFTKRTIKQKAVVTSVDTASEALAVSIAEKACVNISYMAQLLGGGDKIEDIVNDLRGVIFKDPETGAFDLDGEWYSGWQTADEYLSGNVREKLQTAKAAAERYPEFTINVEALSKVQPKDLEASEISVKLGTTWIDKFYIEKFIHELLHPSYLFKKLIQVNYSEHTGEWGITGTGRVPGNDVLANITYGTKRINAYEIIRDTLNLKDVRIYDKVEDENGNERRVLNKRETTLAAQKQEAIKQAFNEWIFKDPSRRQVLVKLYNERFNSVRPREYDGSHINFTGISPEITLREHQLNAVAHILYGGNTLLAHEVGAGKTFEMVAAAMESRRLGLCQKSLFAVPNHLTEQWASEFLRLYPSANILVATKKEFEMKNRKKFCAKIATGDYDAVILGHSQLEKIPMSVERQERLLREQINEITDGIDELKRTQGEQFTIKQLEKTRKSLEVRLSKLADDSRKDSVVTFEQLGIDRLFVDEAHSFKNLFLYTKMRNVAGISQTEAQKSSDLFMKCRYMDELTNNKGIIFASGTPISNSITEMYTMQRYLQFDTLKKSHLSHFDCWASCFGETTTAIELAPEGTGYRARTRFAKFHNLPELMCMFKEIADIKTADMLNLPRPKANFHTIVVPPSEIQKEMVVKLSERAALVHNKQVEPEFDNMLKITSDGRKIGLDQRLMNDMLLDEPNSKVNACMNNIYNIWDETKSNQLTQICFCDFSTPNSDGRFNVYDDIKAKLVEKGVPEDEIAFIHNANTEIQKKELFAKVRQGKVRVLFGSTAKLGAGTNVQDRLVAMHDLDCPWRPADLEQRAGRIVRQGNMNPEVNIYRYVTESTFDAYLYQTIENKQKFISQIMSSKSPVRSCEDLDETALSYAEIKALCAGNPLIKEKMDLDIEVARLRLLKADYQSQHYRLEDSLAVRFPETIRKLQESISGYQSDIQLLALGTKLSQEGFSPMMIHGKNFTEKGKAGAALLEACKKITTTEPAKIGTYRGFDLNLSFGGSFYRMTLKGSMSYQTDLGNDVFGNIIRIDNTLNEVSTRLESSKSHLENLYQQIQNAEHELKMPFQYEQELAKKSERLVVLDAELNMDGSGQCLPESNAKIQTENEVNSDKHNKPSAKSDKPSILDHVKANMELSRNSDNGKNAEAYL